MTDESAAPPPKIPPRRPVRTGDELPTTISELNRKLDAVVHNGTEAIAVLEKSIDKKDRLRKAAVLLAAFALVASFSAIGAATRVCAEGNSQNAKQRQLWEFVVNLSAASPTLQTPEQRDAQVAQLRKFLADTFPHRDCWPGPL